MVGVVAADVVIVSIGTVGIVFDTDANAFGNVEEGRQEVRRLRRAALIGP